MENKALTLKQVNPGNWVIQCETDTDERRYFFVKNVSKRRINGYFLEQLLENPHLISKDIFENYIIFNNKTGRKLPTYLIRPTRRRVEILKAKLTLKLKQLFFVTEQCIGDMNLFEKYGVSFQEKSSWQKGDCITGCGRMSVLEVVYENSRIRCCEQPCCMKSAAKLAKV